jgi:hypothetical protein
MAYNRSVDTATIPSSGTTSDAKTVPARKTLVGMELPAALTSTSMTFQASNDDGASWSNVYNEGTAYSVTVAASRYIALNSAVFHGVALLRLVGGSSEAAARDITLVFAD